MSRRSLLWHTALTLALPASAVASAHAQRPTAAVVARPDVNGDGRADEVRIDNAGGVAVLITGDAAASAQAPKASGGAAPGRVPNTVVGGSIAIDTAIDKGRTIILASANFGFRGRGRFTEAVALAWSPGRLETLWRGKLGAQGSDGASSLSVELGSYGLIKYSSRSGVSRCDGKPAHLDAERYDFVSARFRPARQALRMAAAGALPPLRTSSSAPQFLPADAKAFLFRATGASSSISAGSAAELVAPIAIADGSDTTAWVENKGGPGTGEFVTLQSSLGDLHVRALRLALGNGSAPKRYNRPRRIGVILSASETYWVEVPRDPQRPQWVVFPGPIASSCVTLVIDSVYPGRPLPHTAISEVTVYSDEELDPAKSAARLAERIADGRSFADTKRLLKGLGPGASAALVDAIAEAKKSQSAKATRQVRRLRLALASIPAAPGELVLALAGDGASAGDYSVFSRALVATQDDAIAPLSEALRGGALSAAATKRVATLLAALPQDEAGAALLRALGSQREPSARAAIVHAIARRPNAWILLPAALATAQPAAAQADLYRAMGLAAARFAVASKERLALGAAVANAANQQTHDYEVHYRLLHAAGQIGGEVVTRALIANAARLSTREDAKGLALLRRALSSLGRSTLGLGTLGRSENLPEELAVQSAQAIRLGLTHRDPGARLALLASLSAKTAPPMSVEERLRDDKWPQVRRAAAATLSTRCDAASDRELRTAALEDPNAKVAQRAFRGLLRCEGAGNFALALQLVNDDERPLSLRLGAARVLGDLASDSQGAIVIKHFSKARQRALADRKSGKIASALCRSLADLGSPAVVRVLESSAADPAFPQLQAAAISALSQLCPPSSQTLLERLAGSHEHNVSSAAARAARHCKSR